MNTSYDSYVLCDTTRTIAFGMAGDSLIISGEPLVYFIRIPSRYSISVGISSNIDDSMEVVQSRGGTIQEKHQVLKQWLLENIQNEWKIKDSAHYESDFAEFQKEYQVNSDSSWAEEKWRLR